MSKGVLFKAVWSLALATLVISLVSCGSGGGSSGSSGQNPPPASAPDQVTNPSPATGSIDAALVITLTWNASTGATSYDVYFSTTITGWTSTTQTGTTYNPGALTAGTQYYWRIDAKNAAGTTAGIVWNLTTLALPTQANGATPADNATGILNGQQLSWTAATGATSYDVYFGAASPGTFIGNQAGLTYDPGTLTAGTVYYWRIDVKNTAGTVTGNVWTFTTLALPAQASGPTPVNNATDILNGQQLSWTAATGATSYDVYFGAASPGTFIGNQAGLTYDPGTLTAGTVYYWRIDVKNAAGTVTGNVWTFATLALPAQVGGPTPVNNATDILNGQQLSWTAATGATSYDVYFGTTSPGVFSGNQSELQMLDLGTLTAGTVYYWRIDAKNAAGTTTGIIWNFTTLALPAQVTGPVPPDRATGILNGQQLSWTAATGATSYDVYFGITSPGTFIGNQTDTTYNPGTLTPGTHYYWRIDAKNAAGTSTRTLEFYTQALPELASGPTPADNATGILNGQQLSWTVANGADSYDVYFGTTSPGTFIGNQAGLTYDPGTLTAGTQYYWRIDTINAAGTTTGNVWTFTTLALPAQATTPNPADSAIDVPMTATLSWTAADGAASYDVYFGLTSTNWTAITNTTLTTYTSGSELQYSTLYYWRIDALNEAGTTTGVVWSFQTIPDSPPVLTPPGDQIITVGQELTFTLTAIDPDGDMINYYMDGTPTGAALDNVSGLFSWTPTLDQIGLYTVTFTATSNLLSDSQTITITAKDVDHPPVWVPLTDQTVSEGNTLAFFVTATDPDGDIIVYAAQDLPTGASFIGNSFSWTPGFDQAGQYAVTFTATANLVTITEAIAITVTNVNRAPVLNAPGDYTLDENQTLTFTLSATDPDIDDTITYHSSGLPYGASLNATTGLFNWTPDYNQSNLYTITFWVADNNGAVSALLDGHITVNNVPVPSAAANSATNVLYTSATVHGTVNASGYATSAYFEWGPSTAYGFDTSNQAITVTGSTDTSISANLTGLLPGTRYYYRVVAANSYGTIRSSYLFFDTAVQSPTVSSPYTIYILGTSAGVRVTVNPNSSDTTVLVRWGGSTYTDTTATQDIGSGAQNVVVSFDLTGLSPDTTYNYQVVATNANGSTNSTAESLTTAAEALKPIIWYTYSSNQFGNAAVVNATINANSTDTTVYFEWGASTTYGSTTPSQDIGGGIIDIPVYAVLTGLTPSTTYYFQVVATNSAGPSTLAGNFTTPALDVPSIVDVGAFNLTPASARLGTWINPNSSNTTVQFQYGISPDYTVTTTAQAIGDGIDPVYVYVDLSGLTADTTYNFQVLAGNDAGPVTGDNITFATSGTSPWTQKTQDVAPIPRYASSMVWDGTEAILFGGWDNYNGERNDLWRDTPGADIWTEAIANNQNNSPTMRFKPAMVWAENKAILFGGLDERTNDYLNDLWWYDPMSNTWTQQIAPETPGSPDGRYGSNMVWDGEKVILFGGEDIMANDLSDLWWYYPMSNTWVQKIADQTAGSPQGRFDHKMVYDDATQTVILFGGYYQSSYPAVTFNDTWAYDPSTNAWTQKIAQDDLSSPPARYGHALVWTGSTAVLFGGQDNFGSFNDVWSYDPDTNAWTNDVIFGLIDSPSARYDASMIWDGANVIMFGGVSNNDTCIDNNIYELQLP